jgi:hypothetical protein
MNMMKADVGAVNLRHPGGENNAYMESKINTVGRTTGQSEGIFRGYLADGKVERLQEPFQCKYACGHHRPFSGTGDSGAWVREGSAAVGYIFGGGETDDMRLCTSWIADLRAVCARVEERWGKKLVLYEG